MKIWINWIQGSYFKSCKPLINAFMLIACINKWKVAYEINRALVDNCMITVKTKSYILIWKHIEILAINVKWKRLVNLVNLAEIGKQTLDLVIMIEWFLQVIFPLDKWCKHHLWNLTRWMHVGLDCVFKYNDILSNMDTCIYGDVEGLFSNKNYVGGMESFFLWV